MHAALENHVRALQACRACAEMHAPPITGGAVVSRVMLVLVGQQRTIEFAGVASDAVPLPHPSGASTWHRSEPSRALTMGALRLIAAHNASVEAVP